MVRQNLLVVDHSYIQFALVNLLVVDHSYIQFALVNLLVVDHSYIKFALVNLLVTALSDRQHTVQLFINSIWISRLNCLRRWGWQNIETPQNNILKDKRLSCSILPEITEVRELQHMKTIFSLTKYNIKAWRMRGQCDSMG